jgi:hypothetical protein
LIAFAVGAMNRTARISITAMIENFFICKDPFSH